MKSLSSSAQKIQDTLRELGSDSTVIEFSESTRTAQEAADRVGCEIGQIVKSMVFRSKAGNHAILVLTSGSNRVDEKKIGDYVGDVIVRADPDFVRSATGFAIGGVPPIGHLRPMEIFIDEDLMSYENIWAAAGTPNAVFQLRSSVLPRITHGRIVRVKPG